jgi:hypothetical protein
LPPKPRRERKPIGPDANGLGPDGTPWDPERRARRQAERRQQVNTEPGHAVEEACSGAPGAPPHGPPTPAPGDVVEAAKE